MDRNSMQCTNGRCNVMMSMYRGGVNKGLNNILVNVISLCSVIFTKKNNII